MGIDYTLPVLTRRQKRWGGMDRLLDLLVRVPSGIAME
jgi:hypothetical protein